MIRQKHISICILSLAISMLLLGTTTASAQFKKKKAKIEIPDTVPLLNGFQVSADLLGAAMMHIGSYGQYEGALRVNLRDRYFPIVELGYGKADHTDDGTLLRYQTKAPYGRVGIDFNLMKDKHDIYRLLAGVRYGFTSFKYDLHHPGIKDPVWLDEVEFHAEDIQCNYHWMEVVFGVDATIWGPLHIGWSVRYRNRIAHNAGDLDNVWYVPGYGKSGKSVFGGTFNIIIDI